MKKSICVFLSVLMLASCFALPASAADNFTVSCSPVSFSLEEGCSDSISVDISFENNPGLWATRIFIVYPDGLSLADENGDAAVTNSGIIYAGDDNMTAGTPDLPLGDSRQPDGLTKIIKSENLTTEGFCSTTIYFEPDSIDTITTADGVLATLNFTLTDAAESGDVLDIRLVYGKYDFLYASLNSQTGNVTFNSYYPEVIGASATVTDCPHPSSYIDSKDPACTETGYDRTVCTQCKDILSETVIPAAGHDTDGEITTVPSDCTTQGTSTFFCSACGEISAVETLPLAAHTYSDTVIEPTRTEQGYTIHTCTVCSDEYIDSYVDAIGGENIPGDLNSDDNVNAMDVNYSRRIISGSVTADDLQIKAGDTDSDGMLTAIDANILARFVAGLLEEL